MIQFRNNILVTLVVLFSSIVSFSQDNDVKLANHYFQKGEFDKAELYYKKLVTKYSSQTFFDRYFMTLFYQEKFEEAEKVVEKQIKRDPYTIENKFKLAQVYEVTDRQQTADQVYEELISEMPAVQTRIDDLGKKFKMLGKYDMALITYQKAKKMLRDSYGFQLELAELYSLTGKPREMIQEYLNLLDYSPVYTKTVQTYLSRAIDFEEDKELVEMLKEEILVRVQKNPNEDHYSEMFIWFYIHKKEYNGAVLQAKAFDKRKDKNGKRVYEVGEVCYTNQAYEPAKKAFQYVVDMGEISPYYHRSMQNVLEIEFYQLTEQTSYSDLELKAVADKYVTTLNQLGFNSKTLGMQIRLAKIYAFYMNEPDKASEIVQRSMKMSLTKRDIAELKILLADIYIVSNKIWEASLLYMQVEKEFSEDVIGHEAKFKNAKVFYYDGEFEYAKAQLDVLKASTSKLIANDAMQLSLLLQDNLGIDTTLAPVQMYANADLLLMQNRYQDALLVLDSLEMLYPFHSITDEVLFKKAEIYEQKQNWEKALELYSVVVDSYAHDILADDAAFRMAKIYENRLNIKDKAAEYYKMILFDFPSSLYNSESRIRYRELKSSML